MYCQKSARVETVDAWIDLLDIELFGSGGPVLNDRGDRTLLIAHDTAITSRDRYARSHNTAPAFALVLKIEKSFERGGLQ